MADVDGSESVGEEEKELEKDGRDCEGDAFLDYREERGLGC